MTIVPTKQRWTDAQTARVAEFERTFGRAVEVPAGPRRTHILRCCVPGTIAIQSDAGSTPALMVVPPSGDPCVVFGACDR